jgi:pimeloyl-ACP methyl ester carboxylesterase
MKKRPVVLLLAVLGAGCSGVVLPRFPSTPERVAFQNGQVQLTGAVIKPAGTAPFPAVVFVHGSGPSKHDEAVWKIHSRAFVGEGFAVLSYDKRGSGASTGELESSTYQDLAGDVVAAVRYLRSRADIRRDAIGLFGRSEGGWVAPLAANDDGNIAFVIVSSAPSVSPSDQTLYEIRTRLEKEKFNATDVQNALDLRSRVWAYYQRAAKEGPLPAERAAIESALSGAQSQRWFAGAELPKALPPFDAKKYAAWSAMRYFDPRPQLTRLDAPVLAVFGADDDTVPVEVSAGVLRTMKEQGKKDITVTILPATGHSMMVPGAFPPRYVPEYLELVSSWAAKHTPPPPR